MVTRDEMAAANERGAALKRAVPRAVAARYDRRHKQVVVDLSLNLGVFFSPDDVQGLDGATAKDLEEIEISPSGYGLYFPKLDADVYLPALLEGVFGSDRWQVQRMAARGGGVRSERKAAAARVNGRKGGRPRRVAGEGGERRS